ncbi:hypothetical protein CMI45_02720 [Candidatus Pacearchaeota archaeon]|nr:hypothetical protein [Candidatus Pacearchaeota archaeon]
MQTAVTTQENAKVEEFLSSYWPLHPALEGYQKVLKRIGRKVTEKEIKQLGESYEKYKFEIKEMFGPEPIDEWDALSEEQIEKSTIREYDNIIGHMLKTGLCDFLPPETVLRTRKTLQSLLEKLSTEKERFSIVDLGCGDGRISIGLALFLENLERIYCIDSNEHAIQRTQTNIENLSPQNIAIAKDKVTLIQADFENHVPQFTSHCPEGVDIALSAYPNYHIIEVAQIATPFMKEDGKVIAYYPVDFLGLNCTTEEYLGCMQAERGMQMLVLDLEDNIFDYRNFTPWEIVVGTELTRRNDQS